jgi:hypothetical protein
MARNLIQQSRFSGLSYSEKEGINSSFLWGKSIDHRSDPTKLKLLPRTTKVSGTVVEDLIMDADRQDTDTYLYGDAGNLYKRTSADVWSNLRTVGSSHGNGMKYFGEDVYLYYTSDKVIGRYGPFGGTKTFADDFLGAQGGVPLNTNSLDLEAGSSQYASMADSATLSITGDLSLEAYVKLESLPAVGASMVMVGKWDADTAKRSYVFEMTGISGYFGDGDSGALTVSSDTTQAPVDSACTGTATESTLTATNASFAVGDKLLIHQTRGTNAGQWERNEIAGYTAGTITLTNPLTNTYTSGAQVIVMEEYSAVTVNSGITWTAKAWDGTVGGILTFLCSGTTTVTGNISAIGKGFRGTTVTAGDASTGGQGEGTAGAGDTRSRSANGNGGGGYQGASGSPKGTPGSGGNGVAGTDGENGVGTKGLGGVAAGTADLTTMVFGGGGGGGNAENNPSRAYGNDGGGIVFFSTVALTISGTIKADAETETGSGENSGNDSGGGGGGGGSVLIKCQTATLGTALITAQGKAGRTHWGDAYDGPTGGDGRVHVDYYTSYTGTTNPTLDVTQDENLVTTTAYQLRLGVSTDGTAEEYLTKTLAVDPVVSTWYRYAVTWDASASLATFYLNGVSLGTSTGTLTAIHNNATLATIGAKYAAGTAASFFDGLIDDIRIWNDIRTTGELYNYMDVEIGGGSAGLAAYHQVDSSTSDSTANANNLTLVNTPSYSTDVPFASPTSRLDLDQSLDTSGQTETLPTAIDEGATNRQTFVPAKDPQKSVEILIADKGTGNWTLTVHDALNRLIATVTVANAELPASGDYEFEFASVWRPLMGASYHFHVISSVADGTVTTTTLNDLETVDFHTYYQFLVEDVYHPVEQIINKLGIGNERYLATWDGITYYPHALTLPSGYRIRCLGTWREYLVMGTMRGSNITDDDVGRLFFWDGYSTTYNFYIDIPQGAVNCILSGDPLYFMAGYSGDLMAYSGGGAEKIRRMPKISTSTTLEFNRKAISMYRSLVHIGMAENSTDTTIERGVYSWGTLDKELPSTMSFDYPLSLGITTGATLEIGLVYPIGSKLLISWRNASSYGVDSVSPSNNPYATGTCEFLITDSGDISKEKQSQFLRGYFKALVSGDSVTLKYKIDRQSSWVTGSVVTTADVKEARLALPTKANRFNEFQFGVNLATSNTSSPEFYGIALDEDTLAHERRT